MACRLRSAIDERELGEGTTKKSTHNAKFKARSRVVASNGLRRELSNTSQREGANHVGSQPRKIDREKALHRLIESARSSRREGYCRGVTEIQKEEKIGGGAARWSMRGRKGKLAREARDKRCTLRVLGRRMGQRASNGSVRITFKASKAGKVLHNLRLSPTFSQPRFNFRQSEKRQRIRKSSHHRRSSTARSS